MKTLTENLFQLDVLKKKTVVFITELFYVF